LRDVLALESEVAQAIARRVEATVTGDERARLVAARSVSPEVYESFLKGQFALEKAYSKAGIEESIGYFEEAIKRDPGFAPVYVGLAIAYRELGTPIIGGGPPPWAWPTMVSGMQNGPGLVTAPPAAHAMLAEVYQEQWQWSDAEREYKRALELSPNGAGVQHAFAGWLLCQGRTQEAEAWARRARGLDPFGFPGESMGWILFHSRQHEEAIRELRSSLAVRPNDVSTNWFLGFALIENRQAEEAIPVLEKAHALSGQSPAVAAVLIRAYAHAGRRKEALRLLAQLERRRQAGYVPAAAFVNAYLGLGDHEQAFLWLERAYQEQSMILQYVKVHPYFDPIREDRRFKDLARRVGLD